MDKYNYQEHLKSLYFSQNKEIKGKRNNQSIFKTSKNILQNISKNPSFSKIKQRSLINLILKKILLKNQLEWINYAYVKNETLIIFAKNHIAQSELNYQKEYLLKCFKTIDNFNNLTKISILRDIPKNLDSQKKFTNRRFREKSYGIFDNHVTNQRLSSIIENIRVYIKNLC
jgi:hypothetical protein